MEAILLWEKEKFMIKKGYIVSAIVSVYNCERFIKGCLEDLEQQTIVDKLEIVVVNSGSQQNEEPIINKFRGKFNNIVYLKTENRETIYQAWNRGIKAASGKYITNANTDDRHRKDAFEVMVNVLEADKRIALVYADYIITETENETFDDNTPVGYSKPLEFSLRQLLSSSFIGPHPMWRKNVHSEFGYFDEKFEVAGDYEFWLRISEKCRLKHIKEYLGLFLMSPNSAGHINPVAITSERVDVGNMYMVNVANDKKLVRAIRKGQSDAMYDLGYYYAKEKRFVLARKTFLRCIIYDWCSFKSYQGLIAMYLPYRIVELLRKFKVSMVSMFKKILQG